MTEPTWRKSSSSGPSTNCVEVAVTSRVSAVRDSKDRDGGHVAVDARRWRSFLTRVKAGRFDG